MNAAKRFPPDLLTATSGPNGLPEPLVALKKAALTQLQTQAMPTRKTEDWRYSAGALQNLERIAFTGQPLTTPAADTRPETQAYYLQVSNGQWQANESRLPPGDVVSICTFTQLNVADAALVAASSLYGRSDLPFATLNTARFEDALFIRFHQNRHLEMPLVIEHRHQGDGASYPKLYVLMEKGAQATLIEEYQGDGQQASLVASVTELDLRAQSQLTFIRLDMAGENTGHAGLTRANLGRDSRLSAHCAGFGGTLRRHDFKIGLSDTGAECELNGVCVALGEQHYDNHTDIEHIASHCNSNENYRCIAGGSARIVFNGRIHIHRHAQKSNGAMNNRNLLLSPEAEIDTKPELEIYADDVKCAHGTTIGQLNEEELFYLLTRGIVRPQAIAMLTLGFVVELVQKIPDERTRALVEARLEAFIEAAQAH